MTMWRSFLIATRFLTRLPVPDPGPVSGSELGRSAVFYPVVGLVVGLLVWGASRLLAGLDAQNQGPVAALVLVAWVWLSGGLHLDGLADTADAWVGGLGDRTRTLAIMKDPRSGAFGIIALVLVLLCKWTAITALLGAGAAVSLIWIPVLARAQLLLMFLTTAYARPEGSGAQVGAGLPRTGAWIWVTLAVASGLLFLETRGLVLVLAAGILFLVWRQAMIVRLGGYTGDTAGALVELSETLMLLVVALRL